MRSGILFQLNGKNITGGFKPFFWNLASESELTGWIRDSGTEEGVELYLQGEDGILRDFIRTLPSKVPGAFRLTAIRILKRQEFLKEEEYCSSFTVISDPTVQPIEIPADHKPCPDCLKEVLDPASRRFEHPFFSCPECGLFYSSSLRSPFIRRNTVLTAFPPCSRCQQEKLNENDHHHFGSEALSCPQCGPQFFMLDMYGDLMVEDHVLLRGQEALLQGNIVALQSVYGGFQIFADAFDPEAVSRLRRKRKIGDRPLCLMARDMEVIKQYCYCSEEEEALLTSVHAPVVLLKRREDPAARPLPANVAPECRFLAISLPGTLPEILFFRKQEGAGRELTLAVTCGDNPPGKAECVDIDEVFNRLMNFTDRFLCHDMKTSHACPPSIVMLHEGRLLFIRKARGYVPEGIHTEHQMLLNVGAFGCDAQASIAMGLGDKIFHSQSLGQLSKISDAPILRELFDRFTYLFDSVPEILACDMDFDSLSARACIEFAEKHHLPLVTIQTHHAHALACMAEYGLTRALGIIMNDGSMGPDGNEWGSECLDARLDGFSRIASFKAVSKHNSRPARLFLESLARQENEAPSDLLLQRLKVDRAEYDLWRKQMLHQDTTQLTHSALKVINTICAGMEIAPDFATYPMHCMLYLENQVNAYPEGVPIPGHIKNVFSFTIRTENTIHVLDWTQTVLNLSRIGKIPEEEKPFYARAFYDSFSSAVIAMSVIAREKTAVNDLVLSGSLFLNSTLLSTVYHQLCANGFHVYVHRQSACDESCVPIGQAYAAGLTAQ